MDTIKKFRKVIWEILNNYINKNIGIRSTIGDEEAIKICIILIRNHEAYERMTGWILNFCERL